MKNFIPYGRQSIDEEDIQAVVDVLRSDLITQGPVSVQFEEAIATYCGARYAVAVANGTAALHLAALAAGFGSGRGQLWAYRCGTKITCLPPLSLCGGGHCCW